MTIIEKTYNFVMALSKRTKTDYIIIHNADAVTCTADDIHRWHLNNGWAGIGYHFFVRKDGSVFRGRPIDTVGAQCEGYNSVSIGICFEGKYQTADKVMPSAQKQAGQELLKYLKENYYPQAKVVKHKDLYATDCPGQYFPFDEIVSGGEAKNNTESEENEMIYNYIDENMPEWARPTIQKLVNKGFLKGSENGELGLNDTMLKIFVVNDRAGVYGE